MSQNVRRRYAHTLMFALAYGAIIGAVLFARPLGISATTADTAPGIERAAVR
ncbi:MAG TPA: hypothetical protein VLA00_17625 [Xanthobacteraceae bacterium]|nr:hypothetical protein [Xanthobacteraceae bacterium]